MNVFLYAHSFVGGFDRRLDCFIAIIITLIIIVPGAITGSVINLVIIIFACISTVSSCSIICTDVCIISSTGSIFVIMICIINTHTDSATTITCTCATICCTYTSRISRIINCMRITSGTWFIHIINFNLRLRPRIIINDIIIFIRSMVMCVPVGIILSLLIVVIILKGMKSLIVVVFLEILGLQDRETLFPNPS